MSPFRPLAFVLLLSACGGAHSNAPSGYDAGEAAVEGGRGADDAAAGTDAASQDATTDGEPPDAGEDTGAIDAASTSATCPVAVPAEGSACQAVGFGCQYGSNWIDCNQIATCTASGWSVTGPIPSSCSAASCPASYGSALDGPPLDGGETPFCNGAACWYPEGSCQCGAGGPPGGGGGWACAPVAPGCPYPAPVPGSACAGAYESHLCWYGGCGSSGPALFCTGGIWTSQGNECPI